MSRDFFFQGVLFLGTRTTTEVINYRTVDVWYLSVSQEGMEFWCLMACLSMRTLLSWIHGFCYHYLCWKAIKFFVHIRLQGTDCFTVCLSFFQFGIYAIARPSWHGRSQFLSEMKVLEPHYTQTGFFASVFHPLSAPDIPTGENYIPWRDWSTKVTLPEKGVIS